MRVTAPDLLELGVVDEIVPEPSGGAHADPAAAIEAVGNAIDKALSSIEKVPIEKLLDERYRRFRSLGVVEKA